MQQVSLLALPPEALRRICDTLIATKTPAVNRRSYGQPDCHYVGLQTILSLTTTCRALHEHAADVLWEAIPSFGILVYTLPRDVWSYETISLLVDDEDPEAGPLDVEMNLKRPLVPADFVRFNHYAPRVKRILLPGDCTQFPPRTRSLIFSHNILEAFESYPYGQILPNLRILRSSPSFSYYEHFYRSFPSLFGPNLIEVFTRCPYVNPTVPNVDEDHYRRMLSKLDEIVPNLDALVLNVEGQESLAEAHTPILSSIVLNASEWLNVFHIGNMAINVSALQYLAWLPSLTVLGVKLNDTATATSLAFLREPGKTNFRRLERLHLVHASDLSLLSLFVQHIQPTQTHLKYVDLSVNVPVPFQHIVDFLTTLAHRDDLRGLEGLSLTCMPAPDSPEPHIITEDHLRPFFALRQLAYFNLDIKCEFDIDKATLERIAEAWPNLTVLALGPGGETKTSKVTLDALVPLARRCPRLKRLGLTIDALTPLEPPDGLNGPYGALLLHGPTVNVDFSMLPHPRIMALHAFQEKPPHESPLEELKLGRSAVNMDDPVVVAGFLFHLFPRLKQIHGHWRPMDVLDPEIMGVQLDWTEEETREIIAEAQCGTAWHWVSEVALPEFRNVRKSEHKVPRGGRDGEAALGA